MPQHLTTSLGSVKRYSPADLVSQPAENLGAKHVREAGGQKGGTYGIV